MSTSTEKSERARETWKKAARLLGFEFISPFSYVHDGKQRIAFGFLPRYGPQGSIVFDLNEPPDYEINNDLVQWATAQGYFYSFLNVEAYLDYDERLFLETLEDWA